jgi:protein-tyrosine phosphatase
MPDYNSVLPFDRSYWVIPGKFLAGYIPVNHLDAETTSGNLQRMLDLGIRTFINLMEEHELDKQGDRFICYKEEVLRHAQQKELACEMLRFEIKDLDVTSEENMIRILDSIDQSIAAGKPVYVHCWGGIGRTGTIVGCYLARHSMATGQRAIDFINYLRRTDPTAKLYASPQTEAQRQMVINWQPGR